MPLGSNKHCTKDALHNSNRTNEAPPKCLCIAYQKCIYITSKMQRTEDGVNLKYLFSPYLSFSRKAPRLHFFQTRVSINLSSSTARQPPTSMTSSKKISNPPPVTWVTPIYLGRPKSEFGNMRTLLFATKA